VHRQLNFAGVSFVDGFASFPDGAGTGSLFVTRPNNQVVTVKAEKILIATGSQPFRPGGIPFDGKRIFDSDSINQISFLPRSIAITGSGIIAIEFAKIFRNLGADVTLIIRDKVPRNALMKIGLDKDVAATLVADLMRSGIR
jgi:NAD(P) transhydrogenase